MVSKNVIAALVLVVIVITLVGTHLILTNFSSEVIDQTGEKGKVLVNVVKDTAPETGGAEIKLNVIEKGG